MQIQNITTEDLEIASKQLWEQFSPSLTYLDEEDYDLVHLAFIAMINAHKVQRRKSGDFYCIHPVSACLTLAQLRLDAKTLASCLLHDVPEDTQTTLESIQKDFGNEIAFLVQGVTKLSTVRFYGDNKYTENLRNMFIAMSQDVRVVFIKLADRIHNLQTLAHLPPEKQHRIALESTEIYARIAQRLGITHMQKKIEELCFPYLYQKEYEEYNRIRFEGDNSLEEQLQELMSTISVLLKQNSIEYLKIAGRVKSGYSIFSKEERKPYSELFDLIGVRVITKNVEQCYEILSLVIAEFEVVENRIKDFIAKPKSNGYQSIQITARDRNTGSMFEIQIRTEEMNEFAEYGVASHWAYKQRIKDESKISSFKTKWIEEIVNIGLEPLSDEEYLKRVKLDLYNDRIFVLTPKGDAIDLPQGASFLDFAYRVHEDLGNHAVMAMVNGKPEKISYKLKSGDLVVIITDKKQEPKSDWLNYVTTISASKKIRLAIRKNQQHTKN